MPDCEGVSNSVCLLRPIAPTASENKQRTQCKDKGGMQIIDNSNKITSQKKYNKKTTFSRKYFPILVNQMERQL